MMTTLKIMTVLATFLSTGYVAIDSLSTLPRIDAAMLNAENQAYEQCLAQNHNNENTCEDM